MVTCRVCNVAKPDAEMKSKRGGSPEPLCKACDAVRAKAYAKTHRVERAAYHAAYRLRPEAAQRERERGQQRQADQAHRMRERARHRRDRATEATRTRTRKYLKVYYATHKDIEHAHTAVKYALKTGRLMKPSACGMCSSTERLHAHHDDYSQPLAVRWLCPLCHKAAHKQIKEQRCA